MKDKVDADKLDWSVLKDLYVYAIAQRKNFLILTTVMIVFAIVDVAVPYLMMYAIENYIVPKTLDNIYIFIFLFLVVAILRSVLVAVMINVGGKLNHTIVYQIRHDAFGHLQKLSLSFFDHRPVGWLMARLTSDCTVLGSTLSWGIVDIVWGTAMMLFMALVMLIINWKIALAVLTIVPILFVVSFYFKRFMLSAYRDVREVNSELTGKINEGIMGARTIKTLVHEKSTFDGFDKTANCLAKMSFAAANRSALYLPLVLVIGAVGSMLALYFGGNQVILYNASEGAVGVSYGVLVAFLAYAVKFFQPIQDIANRFAEFQNAQAAAERVLGIMKITPEIADLSTVDCEQCDRANLLGDIKFENMNFSYLESEALFKDFNLTIKSGTSVAIVGHTGSGKTTLTNLLARFYQPTNGKILFNNIDYKTFPLQWLHQQFGIVLQNPHLFRGSIAQNIAYGRDLISRDEIIAAAKLVYADDFINKLPGNYDYILGENGAGLSEGQKQLITFARAILVNPAIMILDEATASIDTQTETYIQKATAKMLKGRTSLIVAHRLSTVKHADRIIVLEAGKIIEDGTHQDLMLHRGVYYQLYTTQFNV